MNKAEAINVKTVKLMELLMELIEIKLDEIGSEFSSFVFQAYCTCLLLCVVIAACFVK